MQSYFYSRQCPDPMYLKDQRFDFIPKSYPKMISSLRKVKKKKITSVLSKIVPKCPNWWVSGEIDPAVYLLNHPTTPEQHTHTKKPPTPNPRGTEEHKYQTAFWGFQRV